MSGISSFCRMLGVACACILTLCLSCKENNGHLYDDNYINNTTDMEIAVTDGSNVYVVPAHTSITISLEHDIGESVPMLSIIADEYPRVKSSYTYTEWRHKTFIIEPSDYEEFTIINTGNYSVEIHGNYLGENYGDSVIVKKQTRVTAKFYNGDSSFTAKYVDEDVKDAEPYSKKNEKIITVF